jgi:hypothetical protein
VRLTDGLLVLAIFIALTRQEFIHSYDKSAYEVRLELAMRFYGEGETPKEAFARADEFIDYLKRLKK